MAKRETRSQWDAYWSEVEIQRVEGGYLALNPANAEDQIWSFYRPDIRGYATVKAEYERRNA